MLLNFLIFIIDSIVKGLAYLLPDYSSFALPQSGLDTIADAFSLFNFIGTLPVARVLFPWILIFWAVWQFVFIWNILIKVLTIIPLFSGLKSLAIRSSADDYNAHPIDKREWHVPVKGIDTNKTRKIKVKIN